MLWLFDIDGTLIRSGGAGSLAMSLALAHEFGVPSVTEGVSFSGRTDFAITKDLFQLHGIPFNESTRDSFYNAYLERLPSALATNDGAVLPGALNWLDHLEEQADHFIGIITGNMKAAAEIKLQHFGLAHRFSFGGYGDSSPDRNDVAAAAVEAAAAYVSREGNESPTPPVPSSKTWVIGDTPFDISCARSQSLRVIGVATGGYSVSQLRAHEPDIALHSLEDTSVLIGLLTGQ